ncbi:Mannitol 2-dehydrogenase [Microbacterium azadirachtae]|uniref:Mannitol-1-phosphate 5-dehydrogenase n=1 Tax=Microbacterium azadirachtae TaxID=582680 RepID=A0A0F0L5R0_9MICO|nr:mannitol dehydrogenase family protein [Microbacterium azadirachtae]KJL26861.1 Mannitol 2-dehydrogenase [Microbacterium azadirachtae]
MTTLHPIDYDRSRLGVGIVHFGVGNFHRAHQALYLDELASRGLADGWGICGVGVLPADAVMRDALAAGDGVYTLVEQHPSGERAARQVGSISRYLFAPEELDEVLRVLAAPETRIVTLTITEGGYAAADSAVHLSVFDIVIRGLERRRAAGVEPFAVVSCDNLPENGQVARRAFVSAASRLSSELAAWVDSAVPFPSTMVDRITPATTDEHRAIARKEFGATDAWPVLSESFRQWVIEDTFPAGRPPLEEVGVQLVDDVHPYELAKLRILNAGHQALAYFGLLAGYRYAHEAATDPVIRDAVSAYMVEAQVTLNPVIDLDAYREQTLERFANPHVRDTLARLATDGVDRVTTFLLPVLRDRRQRGLSSPRSVAILAAWARYLRLATGPDTALPFTDRRADEVALAVADLERSIPAFLSREAWFGDLAMDAEAVAALAKDIDLIANEANVQLALHRIEDAARAAEGVTR